LRSYIMRSILDVCEQLCSKRNTEITLLDTFSKKSGVPDKEHHTDKIEGYIWAERP
jgi:hypothetical protein